MKFTIERVDNGFIIREYIYDSDNEDGTKKIEEQVQVIDTEKLSETKELETMLFKVAELLGYMYNKYGEENLNISFDKKGYKLE